MLNYYYYCSKLYWSLLSLRVIYDCSPLSILTLTYLCKEGIPTDMFRTVKVSREWLFGSSSFLESQGSGRVGGERRER